MIVFRDDDEGFLTWISSHPAGFVMNTRRRPDPDYMILHAADCPTLGAHCGMNDNPGGFTERAYIKACGDDLKELQS